MSAKWLLTQGLGLSAGNRKYLVTLGLISLAASAGAAISGVYIAIIRRRRR